MKIAFMGTGLMGTPMVKRLLGEKYEVVVYNRTISKALLLKEHGAIIAPTPADAVKQSDVIILMLANAQAISDVLLTPAVLKKLSNQTIIQMGTIAPAESLAFHNIIQEIGGDYLEAPVLGSIQQIENKELIVMVGGTEMQFKTWAHLLSSFGLNPRYIGPIGHAAAMKLALNQLIASLTAAFSLSLGFIVRNRVDVEKFMDILRNSALYAQTFDKKLKRMLEQNFANPNFPTKHLLKDVDLFIQEAQLASLETGSLEGVRHIICLALEQGFSDDDYSSIYRAINQFS